MPQNTSNIIREDPEKSALHFAGAKSTDTKPELTEGSRSIGLEI
jgi:hypothetical protein